MTADLLTDIRRWFANLQDGEFVAYDPQVPYEWIAPADDGLILYAAKPQVVRQVFDRFPWESGMGMVGRYGLPDERDVSNLRRLVGTAPVVFLGDLDPPDLLIYAWLHAQLPTIHYFGVSDRLLAARGMSIDPQITIRLSPTEQRAMQTFPAIFADLGPQVGPQCAKLLQGGYKLETEGAFCELDAKWTDDARLQMVAAIEAFAVESSRSS
jgi:hypothetical protein